MELGEKTVTDSKVSDHGRETGNATNGVEFTKWESTASERQEAVGITGEIVVLRDAQTAQGQKV